jgi:iron complex transport system substrate-binding protein
MVIRNIRLVHLILLYLILGCGSKDADLNPIQTTPKRIISLAPSITEALYLLDVEKSIVGVTSYCKYPKQAQQKEKIGTILTPNIEKIYSLKPDLVLATKEINRPNSILKLQELGLNVVVFDARKDFNDICNQFLQLGKILGKERKAKKIIDDAKKQLTKIQKRIANLPKVRVFWEVGAKPLVSVAKGTFADEIISLAGGINIAKNSKVKYPRYSLEEVIKQDPEVIILVEMGDVTKEEINTWQKFKNMQAVKNNRIHIIEAHNVCAPTPITFVKGVKEVANILH